MPRAAPRAHELDLIRLVESFSRGGKPELPGWAEVNPGAVLWKVGQAWKEGPQRDGRRGHLNDEEVAKAIQEELKLQPPEKFDKTKFQLLFGAGRKLGGATYRQPVPQDVARAYLKIALTHWDLEERNLEPRDRIRELCTPFRGLDRPALERTVDALISVMYPRDGDLWYCVAPEGRGPRALYRSFGHQEASVIVFARREPIRFDEPNRQLFDLAAVLNLLLADDRPSVHVWALNAVPWDRPDVMLPALSPIAFLQRTLRQAEVMNAAQARTGDDKWKRIPLARCVVAVQADPAASRRIFTDETPELWRTLGAPANPEDYIPVFASNPRGDCEYYSFVPGRDASQTPFIDLMDPNDGLTEELMALKEAAIGFADRTARSPDPEVEALPGWKLFSVGAFVNADLSEMCVEPKT